MKGLAFAYDPDGYWVELVKREQSSEDAPDFALSQTMLRGKSSLALANSTHTHTTPFLVDLRFSTSCSDPNPVHTFPFNVFSFHFGKNNNNNNSERREEELRILHFCDGHAAGGRTPLWPRERGLLTLLSVQQERCGS